MPEHAGLHLSLVDYKEKISIDEYWERVRYACENNPALDKHIAEYSRTYSKLYHKKLLGEV